jgi:hypothetical protein
MKLDSALHEVFCDVHLERMSLRSYRSNGLLDERTFHVCETPSCARRFAPSLGYVDMVKGQIDPTERAFRDCEKSSIHGKLSKAIVRVQDGEPVWECIRCLTKGSDVRGKVFQLA